MRRHYRSALIILLAWILARLLTVAPFTAQFVKMSDLGIYDTVIRIDRFLKARASLPVYDSIVIVDIDDKSLARLGQFSQWPTQYFADATSILNQDAARVIAFDVMFADSSSFTRRSKDRILKDVRDPLFIKNADRFFWLCGRGRGVCGSYHYSR